MRSKDVSLKYVNSSSYLNDKSFENNINLQSEIGETQISLFVP
jgi:hypothetical protein